MDLENLVMTIDYLLDSRRKRHIVGGILLSISVCGSLLTILFLNTSNSMCLKTSQEPTDSPLPPKNG